MHYPSHFAILVVPSSKFQVGSRRIGLLHVDSDFALDGVQHILHTAQHDHIVTILVVSDVESDES